MVFEYALKVTSHSRERVDALLRNIPTFQCVEPRFGGYTYRSSENFELSNGDVSFMPDAEARIEDYGVYVCVYGPDGDGVLKNVFGQLLSEYNTVEVSKLDWE